MSFKVVHWCRSQKAAVLGLAACLPTAAAAQAESPPAPAPAVQTEASNFCLSTLAPAENALIGQSFAKSEAILGGNASALDAIRSKQNAFELGPLIPAAGPSTNTLSPAMSPPARSESCGGGTFKERAVGLHQSFASGRASGDILGSRRLEIRKTFFDTAWQRVSSSRPGAAARAQAMARRAGNREDLLQSVNTWVNSRIAYVEDRALFGKADYWAGPSLTLALGKGDCEDYALLKMQMLKTAGVPQEDMFLTIARDLVRRADHAVLIVRTDSGYRMLDNATDIMLDADEAMDYRPVLSFSGDRKWVHGY